MLSTCLKKVLTASSGELDPTEAMPVCGMSDPAALRADSAAVYPRERYHLPSCLMAANIESFISVVVDKVKAGTGNFGYNAGTGGYGDMIEMGILDPAKVTRTALQAAASVAGMMITTECMVADAPADEAAGGGMPDMGGMGGGMGGMGGMM